ELRNESEACRGHNRERSLAAAKQTCEVIARVVLLEPVEESDDAAVREHRFDADDLTTGRPGAQDVYTPGVRRNHSADGRDFARSEIHAVLPAGRARLLLQA